MCWERWVPYPCWAFNVRHHYQFISCFRLCIFNFLGFIFMSIRLFFVVVVEMFFLRHSFFYTSPALVQSWRSYLNPNVPEQEEPHKSTKGEARHVKNRNKSKHKYDGVLFYRILILEKTKFSTFNDNQPNGHLHIANKPLNSPFTFLFF